MPNRRPVKQHSDKNFVKAFSRYFLIDYILESKSWNELEKKINLLCEKEVIDKVYKELLFKEFKFYNLTIKIQQILTDSLMTYLVNNKLFKIKEDKIKKLIIEKIEKHRCLEDDKVKKFLIKEKRSSSIRRLLNPFVIFDLAGFTLGDLYSFIKDYTNNFLKKEELLKNLSEFIEYRNIITHTLLAGRIDFKKEINAGLKSGVKLLKLLD